MFRYTAEILPFHDYDFELSIKQLANLGFKEVNLWSSAPPLAHHVNPGDDPAVLLNILRRHNMRPCGLTIYGKSQAEMLERIAFASELGIDTVVFDCEANYQDFVTSFLPPLVDMAAKLGVRIAVENHLTVPFSKDFETAGNEDRRWSEGVDSLAQIKRLLRDIDHPNLGICLAPPHLWVMNETVTDAITFLAERKRLFYYYIWDIDPAYKHGVDGLNFGPGEKQLPRPDGVLDHAVLLSALTRVGYSGPASLKCHGTHGWSLDEIVARLRPADSYIRECIGRVQ